ncbi:hypothetical protein [Tissierella pigra]|uniref:hypothetical protein n=1 Tax=Tissierella pigra TaxID=2607614 RepID=UPI001E3FFE5C|nr:hypothetical protein [Tissierella pigra]
MKHEKVKGGIKFEVPFPFFSDIYLLATAAEGGKSAIDGVINGLQGWIISQNSDNLIIYFTNRFGNIEVKDISKNRFSSF